MWKENQSLIIKRKTTEVFTPPKKVHFEYKSESGRNFNFHITKELEKLKNYYEILDDKGRAISYGNTIRTLRLLPFKVENIDQIRNIDGIGEKTLRKIKEILDNGCLARLETFRQNERIQSMESLTEVHGIGNTLAFSLYKKGIKTISALEAYAITNPSEFTQAQLMGIQLHEEFKQKIHREEVNEIFAIMFNQIIQFDKDAKIEICGSYRRGRDLCGDVDIVLATIIPDLLISVIDSCDIITHTFSLTTHKFIGVCKIKELHRRIDIYVCKPQEY